MRQAMDDGVAEVLSSVVDDVGQAVDRNINGAQLLYELLSAPWLRALLKIYECLLQFQRLSPSPFLPYASGLSHEIMTVIQKTHRPSPEARELYGLLSSPHIQALLSTHDSVAQSDYEPVLPPLPDDMPDDEEAMRIVCLVKNNQPLRGEDHGGSVGDGLGPIRSRWSSLRRLTLERLVPARRAWSGEELRADESDARLLPRGGQPPPFLPQYQSTGSCCLCPQAAEHQKKRLNQSAPSVFSPAASLERPKPSREEGASTGGSSDDYAYPPPPVPAYSCSLPNSPALYRKCATGGQSRNIPTPGWSPSCPGTRPPRVQTAPCSPATQRSTRQQGVSTLPTPLRPHGLQNKCQEDPLSHSRIHYSIDPHRNEPPDFTRQCSVEELRSSVQTSSQDVHHLGHKMMAATGMITDSVEDNAQALNLLVEVVDKLQGLIVARKHLEASPPNRSKHLNKPTPPPRVSSLSPKVVRKPPTPYPHQRSPSSSSRSSSSSSTSHSPGADGFAMSRSPKRLNGGSRRTIPTFGTSQRAVCSSGSNGQVRFNNGAVSRAHLEEQQDCNSTGCLTTKKKTKKKK